MKMQHKGQKYRKWRVIKWKREHARAAELVPYWEYKINGFTADEVTYLESQQERLGKEVANAFSKAFDAWLQTQIDGSGIKAPKGLLNS